MTITLPEPVEVYFASENAHDADAVDECFAADGIVRDERRTMTGHAAIKAWRRETAAKYGHSVLPLRVADEGGRTVVTARVSGNFPGSPIELDHVFDLADGKIRALEIRS
jgi:hypothetical protein